MVLEQLKFIASFEDVIRFCGTDTKLAERYQSIFAEAQGRVSTFDPIMAAASNPEVLANKKNDLWTKKGSPAKRGLGMFDEEKFTKFFITTLKAHLEAPDKKPPICKSGFDAYAYLMAYEEEIMALYGSKELTKLQKAALHFVEVGKEEVELDYLRYIASYDDLVLGTLSLNVEGKPWEEFIPDTGKWHYENAGRHEIMSGVRPVLDFFDATKYIATYSQVQDLFKNEEGTLDEDKAAVAFITTGSTSGFVRNGFNHNVYLANYPELLEEDIYVNKEISPVKVAKLWLQRVAEGVDLTKFDALDFKESNGLDENVDVFAKYVETKKDEYMKMLKKRSKLLNRLGAAFCVRPSFSVTSKKPKAPKKEEPKEEPEREELIA